MSRLVWKAILASELVEALENNALGDLLPRAPAVYLWRRRIIAPPRCTTSADACLDWIDEIATQPAARLNRRQLSHCVWNEGMQVGGGGLTTEKRSTLADVSAHPGRRRQLVNYTEALSQFTPPIYVGQANELRVRVSKHLKGETQLQSYVSDTLGLSWNDLELRYLVVSQSAQLSDDSRLMLELLELITQRVLAPFGTERPG